jgi:uncharacterized protein (UPF0276 family)
MDKLVTIKGPQMPIGVGLRHEHFSAALSSSAAIDFVELHAENFFAQGGATQAVLEQIGERYPISLHSTAMGLGSANAMPSEHLTKLNALAQQCSPILMSDHACFTWSQINGRQVHAGDLLPLAYTEQNLLVLAHNVDRVQQYLGRPLLIENLSAYIDHSSSCMSETEFLVRLTQISGCQLLLDLNNILVTANNTVQQDSLAFARQWIEQIPTDKVGEIHLAGFTPVAPGELAVDDHSQAVSNECWQLYRHALQRFGQVATLVEWDSALPSWPDLLEEAVKAQKICTELFSNQQDLAQDQVDSQQRDCK